MRFIFIHLFCATLLIILMSPLVHCQSSIQLPVSQAVTDQPASATPPVSKLKLYLLSAVSALSPGIALLKVVYDFKDDKSLNGGNNWLGDCLWLFWVIAFLGFTLDKIPGVAHIHHFFEYGVIWFLAYIATTFLNADFATLYGIITGTAAQALRQGLRGGLDTASGGATTPVLSMIEDIVTYVAVSWLL